MTALAVTGATGAVGGLVAAGLAERGVPMRLVVRDPARAPRYDGCEVAVAAYGDADALRRAFDGARTVFFVSGAEAADRLAQHRSVVDAAAAAGVEDVVYLSFLRAAPDATFTLARDHFHTERHVVESGLRYTFLRDSLYLDFLPFLVGADGVIRGPAGEGRFAPVARADVAAAAVAVLLDRDAHAGRTYELTGPTLMTMRDAAAELSRVTGRTVGYVAETIEEAYASRASYGAPDWEVTGWVTSYAAIAAGELEVVTPDVETLTGRPPVGPAAWLDRHPEAYAHLRPDAG